MTNLKYYITHVFPRGWQNIGGTFRIWCDLMCSNYEGYAILKEDNSEEECIDWFWQSLGEDEILPKAFLEHLMQLAYDVDIGKEKTYSLDEVMKYFKEEDDE